MQKFLWKASFAAVAIATLLSPVVSQASQLTQVQVNAIIVLLQSFGADASVVANVQASLTGSSAPVANMNTWCHTFNMNLGIGSRGAEVEAVHDALNREGFDMSIDRSNMPFFNNSHKLAVVGFQEKYKNEILTQNGLTQGTGYVGVATRKKLNQLYGCVAKAMAIPFSTISPISPVVLNISQYYIRPVYFVPTDTTPELNYEAKLQSMWIMVQQFFAEEMERRGFGYRKMNLELDANGKPKIFLIRAKQNIAYYKNNVMKMQNELETIFDKDKSLVAVYSEGFSPWTGGRYVETNLRGGYSYFGDFLRYLGTTVEETKKNMCDKNMPNPLDAGGGDMPIAEILSNRFGGAMHETGHAFGVQHQLVDKLDIVAWGYFGASNWFYGTRDGNSYPCLWPGTPKVSKGTALILNISPFFNKKTVYTDNIAPKISVIAPSAVKLGDSITLDITVTDVESGPGVLLINIPGATVHFEDLRNRGNTVHFTHTITMTSDILPNIKVGILGLRFELFDNDSNRTIYDKNINIEVSAL